MAWKKKTVIGSTILAIIIVSVFLSNTGTSFFTSKNSPADPLSLSQEKQAQAIFSSSQKNEKSTDPISADNMEEESLHEKNPADIKQTGILKKTAATLQEGIDYGKNPGETIRKDSVKETPEKVIVVKKIIRRDTVFIER